MGTSSGLFFCLVSGDPQEMSVDEEMLNTRTMFLPIKTLYALLRDLAIMHALRRIITKNQSEKTTFTSCIVSTLVP